MLGNPLWLFYLAGAALITIAVTVASGFSRSSRTCPEELRSTLADELCAFEDAESIDTTSSRRHRR